MERQTATVAVIFWWGSALAPRKQDTSWIYNPIKTSCLRCRLPFHAFQPAFSWMRSRKFTIKTLLFPSIQKKKTGRGNVHFLWSKSILCNSSVLVLVRKHTLRLFVWAVDRMILARETKLLPYAKAQCGVSCVLKTATRKAKLNMVFSCSFFTH